MWAIWSTEDETYVRAMDLFKDSQLLGILGRSYLMFHAKDDAQSLRSELNFLLSSGEYVVKEFKEETATIVSFLDVESYIKTRFPLGTLCRYPKVSASTRPRQLPRRGRVVGYKVRNVQDFELKDSMPIEELEATGTQGDTLALSFMSNDGEFWDAPAWEVCPIEEDDAEKSNPIRRKKKRK